MRKRHILTILISVLIFPSLLNAALPDTINVNSYSKITDFQVYDTYTYYSSDNTQSGYITSKRIKDLKDEGYTVKETSSRDYRWYRYSVSPMIIYNSNRYLVSGATAWGANLTDAFNAAKVKVQQYNKTAKKCTDNSCTKTTSEKITINKGVYDNSQIIYNTEVDNVTTKITEKYSKDNQEGFTKDENNYKVNATWTLNTPKETTGEINVPQYSHSTSDGKDAYCLQGGARFTPQEYSLAQNYNSEVSNCNKTNDSYFCKLASAVAYGNKNYNGNYLTILTALRLLTAQAREEFGDAAFFDYASGSYATGSKYYTNTVNALESYSGSNSNPGNGILYSKSNLSELQNSIKIYNYVNQSNDVFKIDAKVISTRYDNDNNRAWFIIDTNFESGNQTRITSVTLSDGKQVSDFTYYPSKENCEGNTDGSCIRIVVPMSQNEYNSYRANASIKFSSSNKDMINQMGLYYPKSNTTGYQWMFIFDSDAPFLVPLETKDNRNCEIIEENGTKHFYDNNSNLINLGSEELNQDKYDRVCKCVQYYDSDKDTFVYYDYNGLKLIATMVENEDGTKSPDNNTVSSFNNSCSCKVIGKNDPKKYLGQVGEEVKLEEYLNVCPSKCKHIGDKYYDDKGEETTKETFETVCPCLIIEEEGKAKEYHGSNGEEVNEEEFMYSCSCKNVNGKYYDDNGIETNLETFKTVCPLKCANLNGQYYDIDGTYLGTGSSARELYKQSCACKEVDGHYYNNLAVEVFNYNAYSDSCSCVEIEGGGYRKLDTSITYSKQEYEDSCTCKYINGKYIGRDGLPVSREDYYTYCLGSSYCPNTGLTYEMPTTCEDNSTGTISDPTMCTIVQGDGTIKGNYQREYADGKVSSDSKFNTTVNNTKYCTIFCREDIKFTFMEKEEALAGRYFIYNVESKYEAKEKLSTVILQSKECTSIINYTSWKNDYIAVNNLVKSTWDNLKKYEASTNHDEHTRSVTDCVGNTRYYWDSNTGDDTVHYYYDSNGKLQNGYSYTSGGYNSSYSGKVCTGSSQIPRDNSTAYQEYYKASQAYKDALEKRDELLYQIQDCNFVRTGNNEVTSKSTTDPSANNPVTYTKNDYTTNGKYYVSTDEAVRGKGNEQQYCTGNYCVNRGVADSKITSPNDFNNFRAVITSYKTNDFVTVDYYENYADKNKEDYKIGNSGATNPKQYVKVDGKTYKELDSMTFGSSSNYIADYCGACSNQISGNFKNLPHTPSYDQLDYHICSGSELTAKCERKILNIPNSYVASVFVDNESRYYTNSKFSAQLFTGKVKLTNEIYSNKNWVELEDYIYPVSAYRQSGEYNINIEYHNLGEQNRVVKVNDGDFTCKYKVVNNITNYDCDQSEDHRCYDCSILGNCDDNDVNVNRSYLGLFFRSIDLNDVFPNSIYSPNKVGVLTSRPIGLNWANASSVITEIQTKGDNVIIDDDVNPKWRYKVTLNSTNIKNIRNYNAQKAKSENGYLDNSLSCDKSTYRCFSTFLSGNINSGQAVTNTIGNLDGVYEYDWGTLEVNSSVVDSPNDLHLYRGGN